MPSVPRNAPPLPATKPPFPDAPPLAGALADLASWWLEVRCGCGHMAYAPLRLLAAQHGWRTPLAAILPRLRCSKCKAAPETIDIVDTPSSYAAGVPGAGGPRLRLAPPFSGKFRGNDVSAPAKS